MSAALGVAVAVAAVLILVGAVLAIVRAERGPSMLDRTVALDIVVTCLVAAVALYASLERRADVVPILVVLSLVGFIGSVTIARFAAVEPEDARRVRTREEVAAEDEARLRAELAEAAAREVPDATEDDELVGDPAAPEDDQPAGDPAARGSDDGGAR
ncbi:monovalent cation/H+ antiporter complex subunit F [Cellulomonas sp. 73-145]|uniref:monovalent cation/H+ antiporter complex subunit F n=1 Tax=Cellulomonas sp. 73-145 TaxID=1895739 RepID=UPI0025C17783|nr:monovalent cation/H+ antiporter complex subunit F [Cellulomonas sp. 73-145]